MKSRMNEQHTPTKAQMAQRKPTRDYQVGYCRPPAEHRFKPGNNANPRGRRKGSKNRKVEPPEHMDGDAEGNGPPGGKFNVRAGTPIAPASDRQPITLSNGERVTVNKAVAEQFRGFFNDLVKLGAPVRGLGGFGVRGNPSEHPIGFAVDWARPARAAATPVAAFGIYPGRHMSGDFQDEIECLGIEASPSFVREPEGDGVAERFIRTLKENLLWARTFDTIEELRADLKLAA